MLPDNQTLAVDVSIWLTKFVKAMRNEEGHVRPNAHILGVLRRVCKLIYHNIKPIFVFDGGVPALKRQTIAKRRLSRMNQDVNLQHLVRKILVNKLKQQRLEAPAANADAGGVFTVDSTLPGPVPATTAPSVDVNSEPSDVDVDAGAVSALDSESDDDDKFDFEDEEASEEECDQDDLDLAVLQTMPRDMQLKRAERLSRNLRERHRYALVGVQDDPEAFSMRQMDHFIKQANITQTIINKPRNDGIQVLTTPQEANRRIILATFPAPAPAAGSLPVASTNLPSASTGTASLSQQGKADDEFTDFQGLGGFIVDEEPSPPAADSSAPITGDPSTVSSDQAYRPVTCVIDSAFDDDWEEVTLEAKQQECETGIVVGSAVLQSLLGSRGGPQVPVTQSHQTDLNSESLAGPVLSSDSDSGSEAWDEVEVQTATAASVSLAIHEPTAAVQSDFVDESDNASCTAVPKPASPPIDVTDDKPPIVDLSDGTLSVDEQDELDVDDYDYFEGAIEHELDQELIPTTSSSSVLPSSQANMMNDMIRDASRIGAWVKRQLERKLGVSSQERTLTKDSPPKPPAPALASTGVEDSETTEDLRQEESELREQARKAARDADHVTDAMRDDVMQLLDMFGIPYIVAPMEAEAQCAALEQLGLVDGVITDDSDVFLFGARWVYRNVFEDTKYVEAYNMGVIEANGIDRVDMIRYALLSGSDYTPGVFGVGTVNATEILQAFPGPTGLEEFRDWVLSVEDYVVKDRMSGQKEEEMTPQEKVKAEFKRDHATIRNRWILPENFPSKAVEQAYLHPLVNSDKGRFVFGQPNFGRIKRFLAEKLFWTEADTIKQLSTAYRLDESGQLTAQAKGLTQTTMDSFIVRYEDRVKVADINSVRLMKGIRGLQHLKFADPEVEVVQPATQQTLTAPQRKKSVRNPKKRNTGAAKASEEDDDMVAGSSAPPPQASSQKRARRRVVDD